MLYDEEHRITTSAFTDIAQRSLRQTFRKVAESYPLSHATVKNVFEGFFREHASSLKFKVPTAVGLCSVRLHHVGRISVVCNLNHHTLFDLMPAGFSPGDAGVSFDWRDELEKGQWALYDIQASSLQFAIQAFPTAKTVVHRCHVEQLLALACNDVRNNYDGEIRNVIDQECATGADLVETAVFDDRSFRWGQTIQESIRTLKTGFLKFKGTHPKVMHQQLFISGSLQFPPPLHSIQSGCLPRLLILQKSRCSTSGTVL